MFFRCARAEADPRYPRYPMLPRLVCGGYQLAPGLGTRSGGPVTG